MLTFINLRVVNQIFARTNKRTVYITIDIKQIIISPYVPKVRGIQMLLVQSRNASGHEAKFSEIIGLCRIMECTFTFMIAFRHTNIFVCDWNHVQNHTGSFYAISNSNEWIHEPNHHRMPPSSIIFTCTMATEFNRTGVHSAITGCIQARVHNITTMVINKLECCKVHSMRHWRRIYLNLTPPLKRMEVGHWIWWYC